MLGVGFMATDARAQSCIPGDREICVFDLPNFGGASNRLVRGFSSTAVGVVWGAYYTPAAFPASVQNDWIGSILVGPQTRARICTDANWQGACFDLTTGGWNLGGFDNAISSVRVEWTDQSCWDGPNWQVFPGEVSIYENANQSGDCTTKDQLGFEYSHAGLMGIRNDTLSSLRIGANTQAVVCRNANQGGPCQAILNREPSPLNVNFGGPVGNDAASSIEIGTAPF